MKRVFQVNFIIGYNYPANQEANNNALTFRMACLIVVWYELDRFRKVKLNYEKSINSLLFCLTDQANDGFPCGSPTEKRKQHRG